MSYEDELRRLLPADVPNRDLLVQKGAAHLQLIAEANAYMNLTRITDAREAAIKHVYDSIAPWQHFAGKKHILDAGTGAGFPGVPLSVVFPDTRFSLVESIQKKARFVESAADTLGLPNVHVMPVRAEDYAFGALPDIITARAVAPIGKLLDLFQKSLKKGVRLVLYKGPDVDAEIKEAAHHRCAAKILSRYELPEEMGTRTLIEIAAVRYQEPVRIRAAS